MIESVDALVIGAGVVGLAVARGLVDSDRIVAVVDQEESFGTHTSSRNSEVIHSGVYYEPGSLKAVLCVEGSEKLYRFLERKKVRHRRCGKIIISTSPQEDQALDDLCLRGYQNGVNDLKFLTSKQVSQKVPGIKARRGLWVPSTGIVDSHRLMKSLESEIIDKGGLVSYRSEVAGISKIESNYLVEFLDGTRIRTKYLINSGGLWADKIAGMVGISEYQIRYCKGEYYRTTRYKNMRHLVYPVPDPEGTSLGIHTRLFLTGEVAFGPNACYVDTVDYGMSETCGGEFVRAIEKYLEIDVVDISPAYSGIRPKLFRNGKPVRDFVIEEEEKRDLSGFVNLLGIESPGLTCCLSIADRVADLISTPPLMSETKSEIVI